MIPFFIDSVSVNCNDSFGQVYVILVHTLTCFALMGEMLFSMRKKLHAILKRLDIGTHACHVA